MAKANTLFGCIVSLIRDVGGEPVLLTPESVQGAVAGSGAAHSLTADGGPSGRVAAPGAPTSGTPDGVKAPDAPEALDGVVLPGGGDVDPRIYGEEPGPALYDVNAEQDRLDFAVARRRARRRHAGAGNLPRAPAAQCAVRRDAGPGHDAGYRAAPPDPGSGQQALGYGTR